MTKILITLAALVPALAFACDGTTQASAAPIKKLTIAQYKEAKGARAVDANTPEFRVYKGTIPNAVLLTSSSQYDVAKELPPEKDGQLVFFCANTHCTASDAAAQRAIEAGYTNVAVLPAGIEGWRAAGQKTQPVKPQS